MNTKREKITKVSGTLAIVTKILMVNLLLVIAALIIAGIASVTGLLSLDKIALNAPLEAMPFIENGTQVDLASVLNPWSFAGMLILSSITLTITYFLLADLSGIFKDLSKGVSPFHADQIKRLKGIANKSIGIAIMNIIISVYLTVAMKAGRVDISISLTSILFPIIIYFLAYIFEYGSELQQLSDETL